MAKYFMLVLLSSFALHSCSQSPAPTTPKTTPVTTPAATPAAYASEKEGWLVDLDEAYAVSKKSGKPILANFTGSDWCGWCKRLDADVFSKPEFKDWAQKNVVLLELDFPRKKQIPQKNQQQNAAMQQAMQITGYPTIWLLNMDKDAAGKYQINPLGKTGYTPTAQEFIGKLDGFIRQG